MNTKDKLVNYYKEHLFGSSYKLTHPEERFAALLEGVDDSFLRFILDSLKAKKIRFNNSSGYNFDPYRLLVNIDIRKKENQVNCFHELGHMIDFVAIRKDMNGYHQRYIYEWASSKTILSNGLSLEATLKKELRSKAKEISDRLLALYQNEVVSFLPNDFYARYIELHGLLEEKNALARKLPSKTFDAWLALHSLAEFSKDPLEGVAWEKNYSSKEEALKALKRKNEIGKLLGNYKELNTLASFIRKQQSFKTFENKYSSLLDMIGIFGANESILPKMGHSTSYLKQAGNAGTEFFAECFSYYVTGVKETIQTIEVYLPESFACFQELFAILMEQVSKK